MSYELVNYIKEHSEIKSDYEISEKIGVDRRLISKWKTKGQKADGVTMLKLVELSGLNAEDALKIVTNNEDSRSRDDQGLYIMLNWLVKLMPRLKVRANARSLLNSINDTAKGRAIN